MISALESYSPFLASLVCTFWRTDDPTGLQHWLSGAQAGVGCTDEAAAEDLDVLEGVVGEFLAERVAA